MPDAIEMVLQLVAQGRITPEEASLLLSALDETVGGHGPGASTGRSDGWTTSAGRATGAGAGAQDRDDSGRTVKVEVTEDGEVVVNLRLPAALGDLAMRRVPGLSENEATRIREALRRGLVGDILRVIDDGGNGVRISVE
jgi:hypothetical protein